MGYPYSTGMSTMDWRITDEASDPTGATEQFHTERLIRLEGCAFCYRPTDSPHLTDLPACAAGAVTFAVFNRMAKVNAHAASTWARVLAAVPDSRLMVLVPGGEGNATARRLFESCGVPGRRLRLVPTGPRADYLALAREADILLDTFPYGGMTTTCDFLWMGLPTVTLAGALPPWRAGVSLLAAVGLPHLIATTAEQYVQIAVRLAQDLPNLRSLRAGLRERMGDSDLRNEARFVGKLESAYREMWRAWAHTTVRTPTV
jgi:predicted O-linked N-acetylglucosamine transferase (SPINDLY family)